MIKFAKVASALAGLSEVHWVWHNHNTNVMDYGLMTNVIMSNGPSSYSVQVSVVIPILLQVLGITT